MMNMLDQRKYVTFTYIFTRRRMLLKDLLGLYSYTIIDNIAACKPGTSFNCVILFYIAMELIRPDMFVTSRDVQKRRFGMLFTM